MKKRKNTAFHFLLLHTHLTHNTKIPSLFPTSVVIPHISGLYWALSFVCELLDDSYWTKLCLPWTKLFLPQSLTKESPKTEKREDKGKK